MMLPYITKYKCSDCEKLHRLSFAQFKKIIKERRDYLAIHHKATRDTDIAIKRMEKKFGGKLDNTSLIYKIGRWLMDKSI